VLSSTRNTHQYVAKHLKGKKVLLLNCCDVCMQQHTAASNSVQVQVQARASPPQGPHF
jgi:hypothetical protein